jgi:O-antigen/teichoic acid export membrane protein
MNPASFGETQTIISFFTQISTFFVVLGLISIGIITKYSDEEKREELTNELSRVALGLSIFFLLLSFLFSTPLRNFFHFSSSGPFILMGIALVINVPLSFSNAYLQGNKHFKSLSIVNVVSSVSKLILSAVLVLVGLKTMGAIAGLLVAQLIGLFYSLKNGKGLMHFIKVHFQWHWPKFNLIKPELPYAVMVLATSLTTNLFISFDILVVKHYFTPVQAGLYTGISIISNIIFFITGPFAAVMIPSIKLSRPFKENQQILKRSLLITASTGGLALLIFLLAPHFVVLLLLGKKYAVYSSFLRGLSFSMFALSIANLLIYYHIGLRHFLVAPMVLVGLITTLILLDRKHATMGSVVWDLVVGAIVLLVLMFLLLFVYRRELAWRHLKPL